MGHRIDRFAEGKSMIRTALKIIHYLIWSVILAFGSKPLTAQNLDFYHYRFTGKDGLSTKPTYYHIAQDQVDGKMLICGPSGLIRYDGSEFKAPLLNGVKGNNYLAIRSFQDRTGKVWVLLNNGNMLVLEENNLTTYTLSKSLSQYLDQDGCTDLKVDDKGCVLLGTYGHGYFQIEPNGTIHHPVKRGDKPSGIYLTDVNQQPFVYGILTAEDKEGFPAILKVNQDSRVDTVFNIGGQIWNGKRIPFKRLRHFTRRNGNKIILTDNLLLETNTTNTVHKLLDTPYTSFAEDLSGSVWMASPVKRGVLYYSSGDPFSEQGESCLRRDRFHCITTDDQGGVWLPSSAGCYYVPFSYVRSQRNEYDRLIAARDFKFKGEMPFFFISSQRASINIYDGKFGVLRFDKNVWAQAIYRNRHEQSAYFGVGKELFRVDSKGISYVSEVDNNIVTLNQNVEDGSLLIGTQPNILRMTNGEIVEEYPEMPFKLFEIEYHNSSLYAATANGLWVLDEGQWKNLENLHPLLSGRITHVKSFGKHLWVFNSRTGACRMMADSVEEVLDENGHVLTAIKTSVVIDNKLFIVASPGRMLAIESTDTEEPYEISTWLVPGIFSRYSIEAIGKNGQSLFFSDVHESYQFFSEKFRGNPSPTLNIADLKVKGEAYKSRESYVLPYDSNFVQVFLQGQSYHSLGSHSYYYKMSGIQDWTQSKSNVAEFKSLPVGDHLFEAYLFNGYGQRTAVKTLSITILPPFYQTWWFYSLLVLATAIIVWFLVRLRLLQLKRRSTLMEELHTSQHQALNARMNPHFIFNSLNSIYEFTKKHEVDKAQHYLSDYASLMRLTLENSGENLVTLQTEINALTHYLALEKMRLKERFEFRIEYKESLDLAQFVIPPMLLHPFVENAIWHGLAPLEKKGHLAIHIRRQEDNLSVTIADNGVGRVTSKELGTSIHPGQVSMGGDLVKRRLEILKRLFDMTIQIFIEDLHNDDKEPCGTRVALIFPVIPA